MSDGFNELRKDLGDFSNIISNLSAGVNSSGIAWRDAQYAQLAEKISAIASGSKELIQVGQRCESAMGKFEKIASEV